MKIVNNIFQNVSNYLPIFIFNSHGIQNNVTSCAHFLTFIDMIIVFCVKEIPDGGTTQHRWLF